MAGRGDIARTEAEQCIAARTTTSPDAPRCRLRWRVRTPDGAVCSSHHVNGFIPFVLGADSTRGDAIALRMAAVMSEAA